MLLSIKNLSVQLKVPTVTKDLLRNVDLEIPQEKIVGLVGGSGSGKTTMGLAILRLLAPELAVVSGKIVFQQENLLDFSEHDMRRIRGKEISMVFQEPLNAFNPVFTIGRQIDEVLSYHTELTARQRQEKVLELLHIVDISDVKRVAGSYPHQISGGMRQRSMLAQALAANPKLIIADEPTSNIDVTLQARIMDLFRKLCHELKVSVLLITHDLGVVAHLTQEVFVMQEGRVVEFGQTKDVLAQPQHPYTIRLVEACGLIC